MFGDDRFLHAPSSDGTATTVTMNAHSFDAKWEDYEDDDGSSGLFNSNYTPQTPSRCFCTREKEESNCLTFPSSILAGINNHLFSLPQYTKNQWIMEIDYGGKFDNHNEKDMCIDKREKKVVHDDDCVSSINPNSVSLYSPSAFSRGPNT